MTPRTLVLAACVVLSSAICVRLGFWQLSRMREKHAIHAAQRALLAEPPIDVAQALPAPPPPSGRRVRVHGRWDRSAHVLLSGRTHMGAAGVSLVSALRLLLVQKPALHRDKLGGGRRDPGSLILALYRREYDPAARSVSTGNPHLASLADGLYRDLQPLAHVDLPGLLVGPAKHLAGVAGVHHDPQQPLVLGNGPQPVSQLAAADGTPEGQDPAPQAAGTAEQEAPPA